MAKQAASPKSAQFAQWFGKSKVVDAEGQPLVVYHGTVFDSFYEFKLEMAEAGAFFFTDSFDCALSYAGSAATADPVVRSKRSSQIAGVYRVYLRMENPLVIDAAGGWWGPLIYAGVKGTNKIVKKAKAKGFDGVIFQNIQDWGAESALEKDFPLVTVYAVFHPNQIKSATKNSGAYSLTDNDIRKNPKRHQ